MASTGGTVTFSRRKKDQPGAQRGGDYDAAPQGAVASTPVYQEANAAAAANVTQDAAMRWRRKVAPSMKVKQEADQQAELEEIRAHFQEVDLFDLAVETPTPPAKTMPRPEERPRPMSLGLSRRSSIVGGGRLGGFAPSAAAPSPLKINIRARYGGSLGAAAHQSLPAVEESTPRAGKHRGDRATMQPRSSVVKTDVLGRLSNGITGMLHWFGQKGSSLAQQRSSSVGATKARAAQSGQLPAFVGVGGAAQPAAGATHDLEHEFAAKLGLHEASASGPLSICKSPLEQLLLLCGQQGDVACLPSMEELLGQHVDLGEVKKVGEGTFGEAFKAGNVVLKIVPMEGLQLVNGEVQKRAEEIMAEVAVTMMLSELRHGGITQNCPPTEDAQCNGALAAAANTTSGFVETFGVGVCRGIYAPALLEEWHRWDGHHTSENDPVDMFHGQQLFVVFVVADGGLDLEHFGVHSFAELRSILLQTAMTLAVAEEACAFEHRDLHWGNLLISRDGSQQAAYRLRDVDIKVLTAGVRVTLIDFTLSRLSTCHNEVAFCDLGADPDLFTGPKGDPQADTYRRMRKATKGDWRGHTAATNTLWLHYLADIMLMHKLPGGCNNQERVHLRNFRKRVLGAPAAAEAVWDEFFAGQWSTK